MIEINIDNILSYKIKQVKDYNKGGFYLILNTRTNKKYIGKSIDYLSRLKQHLYKSNNRTLIDIELKKSISDYKFYLLHTYNDFDINFFNRNKSTIIEQKLIKEKKSYYPNGFNVAYYEHI
jgi:hypothetical protein